MSNELIWIIDDDPSIRWVLERALQQADMDVRSFISADQALKALPDSSPKAIISDIRMPGMDGLSFLDYMKREQPDTPVIIMTAHSDLDSAVSSYEGGAFEYLPKPFDIDEVVTVAQRACKANQSHDKTATTEDVHPSGIIGVAPAMQEVFRAIGRLSRSNITVLINGESGSGKELIAHALHRHSPRATQPFIALNMAAIPHDLLESELFGHEKGAFTGAQQLRLGRFEQANGGTLFLDEIGDMPAELQTRLLRVLSDARFYRIGGHKAIKVDVRIVAATHQNLESLVKEGRFREDLFHRLNVIRIHSPALRERREDIPLLLNHFLNSAALELKVDAKIPLPEVEQFLSQQAWPGNVRQLENMCRWLTVMATGNEIHLQDLPNELQQETAPQENDTTHEHWQHALQQWAEKSLNQGGVDLLSQTLPIVERILIETTLKKNPRSPPRSSATARLGTQHLDPQNQRAGHRLKSHKTPQKR
ncbi:MAG: nitrogen regulation protein NR(I) [Gammaproteobacteria bacterium]|nr:nitrogen regulation protein NR(I) [Gammaproteobacteria bacterium]